MAPSLSLVLLLGIGIGLGRDERGEALYSTCWLGREDFKRGISSSKYEFWLLKLDGECGCKVKAWLIAIKPVVVIIWPYDGDLDRCRRLDEWSVSESDSDEPSVLI